MGLNDHLSSRRGVNRTGQRVLAALVLIVSLCKPAKRDQPVSAEIRADSGCGSQGFATVALGDALSHVRAARLFATDQDQREALARLEPLMVRQIEAEPDSAFRGAAWLQAEAPGVRELAEAELRRIEDREDRWLGRGIDATVNDGTSRRMREEYSQYLEEAVKLVDPRSPKRCAETAWHEIFAAALSAQAK